MKFTNNVHMTVCSLRSAFAIMLISFPGLVDAAGNDCEVSASARSETTEHVREPTPLHAVIERSGCQIVEPRIRGARFEQVTLDALEIVEISLLRPALAEGSRLFIYTVNGGRVNGNISDFIEAGPGGKLSFTFQAGKYFGDYPVVLRHGGREESLNFWVKQADLKVHKVEKE